MDTRIFQLRAQILSDFQRKWTIEEMAQAVGLSAPHLIKLFRTETGTPLLAYLRERRLEKARELLKTDFKQIQEIRAAVGMFDESHFARDFKKRYSLAPTEYRKRHWAKIAAEISPGENR